MEDLQTAKNNNSTNTFQPMFSHHLLKTSLAIHKVFPRPLKKICDRVLWGRKAFGAKNTQSLCMLTFINATVSRMESTAYPPKGRKVLNEALQTEKLSCDICTKNRSSIFLGFLKITSENFFWDQPTNRLFTLTSLFVQAWSKEWNHNVWSVKLSSCCKLHSKSAIMAM